MSEGPIDPDDIDSVEDLVGALNAALEDAATDRDRLDNLVVRALENSRENGERLDDLEERQSELSEFVEEVNATMPDQQKSKLQKIRAIIEKAAELPGGQLGTIVTYDVAMTAAGCSKQHAHTLMDEIGGRFDWADVKAEPGKKKQLRIAFGDRDVDDLVADVRDTYSEGEVTA